MMKYDAHSNEYREDYICYIYDEYKSVYGVRPRWMRFDEMTTRELIEQCEQLEKEIKESIEQDRIEALDLEARVAAADANPKGIVWDDANTLDREFGITDIQAYIPPPTPVNPMMANAMRAMLDF